MDGASTSTGTLAFPSLRVCWTENVPAKNAVTPTCLSAFQTVIASDMPVALTWNGISPNQLLETCKAHGVISSNKSVRNGTKCL